MRLNLGASFDGVISMILVNRKPGRFVGWFIGLLLMTVVVSACDTPSRQFDSAAWKAGDSSVRGGMSQDLMDRKLLADKSKTDVEMLLGKPDSQSEDAYSYEVITIARCRYVWKCRLDVVFDRTGNRVKSVAVSD